MAQETQAAAASRTAQKDKQSDAKTKQALTGKRLQIDAGAAVAKANKEKAAARRKKILATPEGSRGSEYWKEVDAMKKESATPTPTPTATPVKKALSKVTEKK